MTGHELIDITGSGALLGIGLRWLLGLDLSAAGAATIGAASWAAIVAARPWVNASTQHAASMDFLLGTAVAAALLGAFHLLRSA